MNSRILATALSVLLFGAACGTEEPGELPGETLELVGSYDGASGDEAITATTWGAATIIEFSNILNFAITQNAADAMFNPSKFNKVVWTEPQDGAFQYCVVEFGKDTAEEARASTMTADASNTASGCGGSSWTELYQGIEIEGTYHSKYGGLETIDHRTFAFSAVVEFDNDLNFAITQSPVDDMFNPNKFSKIVWTEPSNGRFFYCFLTFGEDTAEAAKATTEVADSSDPRTSGCGGFPWTELEPPFEVSGEYTSNFGTDETLTSDMWGTALIREYDNDENVAYLQLPEDDEFNPNKFNKVVYTEPVDGSFYYCWVDFGLDTLEAAKMSSATWDTTDPENSGCGGFAWTKLSVR